MAACRLLFGAVPSDLRGVYYRNGPDVSKGWYASPLDGDGRVDRVEFSGRSASLISRVVQTAHRTREDVEGRVVYQHTFGTQPTGPPQLGPFRSLKNSANTGVVVHGGDLLATWEGGHPHHLDHATLETRSVHAVGGLVSPGSPFTTGSSALDRALGAGGEAVCAHWHRCHLTGRKVLFTTRVAPSYVDVRILELNPTTFRLAGVSTFRHPGFTHFHDFCLTRCVQT